MGFERVFDVEAGREGKKHDGDLTAVATNAANAAGMEASAQPFVLDASGAVVATAGVGVASPEKVAEELEADPPVVVDEGGEVVAVVEVEKPTYVVGENIEAVGVDVVIDKAKPKRKPAPKKK